jgi:transcriptional regulator with PAS, ATPase and Fis domain/CHASE2 domain-containing sensor protein
MSEPSMSSQARHALVAMVVVVCCAAMSFGFSHIFPQGDRWLTEWQLSHLSSPPVAPSIVLVRAEEASPALCGEGRWNLNALEATFLALHQAGASVIAPMIEVSVPIPSECGGLSGLVHLAEVTKHVGTVVYPDSVPPALAQAAIRTGSLGLASDDDGMVSGFTFSSSSLNSLSRPFGSAVAALASTSETAVVTTDALLYVPGMMPKKDESLFPTYPFTDVWSLVQAGEREKLVRLFQGKIVFLYSGSSIGLALSTPRQSNVPVALFHAKLANAYLTNSWVLTSPFAVAFLVTVSLGGLLAVPMFRELSLSRLGLIGLGIALVASGFFFFGFHWGRIWPLFSMGLSVGMTIVGVVAWRFLQSRATVQERIAQREQQLTQLEHEFAGKQNHVRQLEGQLYDAQHQTNQSVTVIEELQVSQNSALSQLERYQDEMQETRRKMDRLQEELHDLRQHVSASPAEVSSEDLAVDHQELIQECEAFQIVTRDQTVLRLFQNLKKAAATQVPILLLGETGTGKEVFAKAAHALSPRRQGPFISVNMAAIRSELFEGELFGHVKGAFTGAVGRTGFLESAHGGTLFLDEVGDLPLDLQAKLLRFLEDGGFHRVGQSCLTHIDTRIIAATNRDLQREVQAGRYREDLYYRLRGMVLTLPPLRARCQADHMLLAQSFLQQCAHVQHRTDLAFTQGALDAILAHQWPGNIRELRQTISQAVALANGPMITEGDLNLGEPTTSVAGGNWVKEDLGQREDAMVLDCLRRHKFEMQATATTLGWDRGTVTQRLKGLGFQALMEYQGNIQAAAHALAGDERFVRVVEGRLREYANNLVPPSKHYGSVEEAIADCRKRFRNLPERHFPAVEQLIHARFTAL